MFAESFPKDTPVTAGGALRNNISPEQTCVDARRGQARVKL